MGIKDWIIIALLGVLIFIIQRPTQTVSVTTIERDTVCDTIHDTIRTIPSPPKIIERWRDTVIYVDSSKVNMNDTVTAITLPLNHYLFEEPGVYKIKLEGIAVKPISFEIIQPTITNAITGTITNTTTKHKRLNWGAFGGVGVIYGTKGLDIGFVVGVGLQYKF